MRHAICLPPLPLSLFTCFSFTPKQMKAPCSQTSPTLRRALLMVRAFFTIAMVLKAEKDAHCTWQLSTSTNHLWIGNRRCVGSCRSRLIGKCAKTTWKLPPYVGGLAQTGATTAQKWNGAARKAPTPMSVTRLFSTAWQMSYPRLLAPKSSCN